METADPRGRIHHKMRLLKLHKLGKCSSCVKSHVGRLSHKRNTSRICKKRKVKVCVLRKENALISAPGYNRDYWTWLFVVLGPSTGLELSEASLLGGILSFSMSRSAETHISHSDLELRHFTHLWPPRRRWSCGGERILAVRPSARSSLPTARPVAGLRWESAPSVATLAQIPPCEHNVRRDVH